MALEFRTKELRDTLANRLADLAKEMVRSFDQGNHNSMVVTPEMVDDVRTAAVLVGAADIRSDGPLP